MWGFYQSSFGRKSIKQLRLETEGLRSHFSRDLAQKDRIQRVHGGGESNGGGSLPRSPQSRHIAVSDLALDDAGGADGVGCPRTISERLGGEVFSADPSSIGFILRVSCFSHLDLVRCPFLLSDEPKTSLSTVNAIFPTLPPPITTPAGVFVSPSPAR